tara:strand:+ start:378 stop:665 length:288 start_codon:yes stop_codon:yes gene_type:complete
MIPQLKASQDNSQNQLTRILNDWCDNQGLNRWSADDLLASKELNDDQEEWLTKWVAAWNGLLAVECFIHHLNKEVDPEFIYAMKNFQNNEVLKEQ